MSKKVFTAAELFFLVILLSLVVPFASEASANPLGWFHSEMTISLLSPQNGFHYNLPLLVNFTSQSNFFINLAERAVNADGSLASNSSFYYVVDGNNIRRENVTILGTRFSEVGNVVGDFFSGHAYLSDLSPGLHNVTLYYFGLMRSDSPPEDSLYGYGIAKSVTVQFYVDTETTSPSLPSNDYLFIAVMQPGQGWDWHYNVSGPLTLFYRTAKPLNWVGYSLDEAQNVTLVRNGTELPLLPDAKHSLKLYGNDSEGKMYSSWVIWFSTHQNTTFPFPTPSLSPTQTTTPEASPTTSSSEQNSDLIAVAVGLAIAVTVVGLLVVFGTRRGRK